VRRLLATARERGTAVAIGHPHSETIAALKELRAELLDSGVQLVSLSALVPVAGVGTTLAAAADGAGRSRPGRATPAAHP
jgi:hypothetical protein